MERRSEKRSLLTTFAVLCIMLVMICVVTVPGIYAKYTSQVSGKDTATVAKWSFEVNDTEIAATNPTVTFDLFNTIKDTDGTSNETDVTADMIAPGTSGEFALKLENLSDVTAVYKIEATVTNGLNVPLKYKVGDAATWSNTLQGALDAALPDADARTLAKTNGTKTITVKWMWAFDGADATDTTIGIGAQTAANAKVEVTTTVTAEQVD